MKKISALEIHKKSEKLEVFLFNVGQGDHLLLKFPSLEYGIIDFHYGNQSNITEPPSLSYFKELKKELSDTEFEKVTISFICISHTDKDHVKGVKESVEWFNENGVFIKDFWLGAARDQHQLTTYLKIKFKEIINRQKPINKYNLSTNYNSFRKDLETFFEYLEKWKKKGFKSNKYKEEKIGKIEYLGEIRSLPYPSSSSKKIKAINMGPLGTHLDDYVNNMTLETVKQILNIKDKKDKLDKNQISHILRIQNGKTNLLFGGDTDKHIWDSCLSTYDDDEINNYRELFGDYSANFIKVSHHGSRFSSSETIWKKIIAQNGKTFLGISAGQNKKYKHPHSETLNDIKKAEKNGYILSTNICHSCLSSSTLDEEHHIWYDQQNNSNKTYKKKKTNLKDAKIDIAFKNISNGKSNSKELGLFAYIFEIPEDCEVEDIKVRKALSRCNDKLSCFFANHEEKLNKNCY